MANIDPLLKRNQAFAATGAHDGLSSLPRRGVFVVTCMDSRVDPASFLGLELGDALVMRNAGGRVTAEVIGDIAFIAQLTTTIFGDETPAIEIVVIHHTECGTAFLADETFRGPFAASIRAEPDALTERAVVDPFQTVRLDVDTLRKSPLLPAHAVVSGHVYDVASGLVETVEPAGR